MRRIMHILLAIFLCVSIMSSPAASLAENESLPAPKTEENSQIIAEETTGKTELGETVVLPVQTEEQNNQPVVQEEPTDAGEADIVSAGSDEGTENSPVQVTDNAGTEDPVTPTVTADVTAEPPMQSQNSPLSEEQKQPVTDHTDTPTVVPTAPSEGSNEADSDSDDQNELASNPEKEAEDPNENNSNDEKAADDQSGNSGGETTADGQCKEAVIPESPDEQENSEEKALVSENVDSTPDVLDSKDETDGLSTNPEEQPAEISENPVNVPSVDQVPNQESSEAEAREDSDSRISDVASANTLVEYVDPAAVQTEQDILVSNTVKSSKAEDVLYGAEYASENSTRGFVYRLYHTVLQREPDAQGFAHWVHLLESGEITAADAVEGFFGSKEYQSKNKTNEEIVTDCYQTMLNRAPDQGGFKHWLQHLNIGMTPEKILEGFVHSSEFTNLTNQYGVTRGEITLTNPLDMNYDRTYFVYRMYKNCLGREPDRKGQEFWVEQLANGMTGSEIASGFFFSGEFNKRRYDNGDYVDKLYQTILGRQPELSGYRHWKGLLDYTCTRENILNGFIGSVEFGKQCQKADIQAGDPIDTPDDTEEWQNNIQVLKLCNDYRRSAGLADLHTREDLLWDLAMKRTDEITEVFSHTRPNGADCFTLFVEQGFYGSLGENLAGGQSSAAEVVNAWMNSPGHRANILSDNYTYLATGYIYDPTTSTYCAEGKYTGQYVKFNHYWGQSFCNYAIPIK